jgi:hypothetical protein
MKKVVFRVALLMMTTSYVFSANAGEKENPTKASSRVEVVATPKASVYNLFYSSEREGAVKVTIYDTQGNNLYTDYIRNAKTFKKSYDFSGLAVGTYQIEVVGEGTRTQKNIEVVKTTGSALNVKVVTVDEKGKYNLQVKHANMTPVFVNIYDDRDEVIFQEQIDVDHNFSRVYDLTKAFEKAASFEVYSDGESVRQAIR